MPHKQYRFDDEPKVSSELDRLTAEAAAERRRNAAERLVAAAKEHPETPIPMDEAKKWTEGLDNPGGVQDFINGVRAEAAGSINLGDSVPPQVVETAKELFTDFRVKGLPKPYLEPDIRDEVN